MMKYKLNDILANLRTHIPDFDMATEIMSLVSKSAAQKNEALRDVLEAMKGARHEIFSNLATQTRWTVEQIDNYPPLKKLEQAIATIEGLIGGERWEI